GARVDGESRTLRVYTSDKPETSVAQVTIREARSNLKALIDRAQAGEEIEIFRRGRQVARLLPPERKPNQFPDLDAFRASIEVRGEALSETVIRERRTSRY